MDTLQLAHVGIRTSVFENTVATLEILFQSKETEYTQNQSEQRIAFIKTGNCEIEVIEDPLIGCEQSVIDHFGIETENIVETMHVFRENGIPSSDEAPRAGLRGSRVAAFEKEKIAGINVHLIENGPMRGHGYVDA